MPVPLKQQLARPMVGDRILDHTKKVGKEEGREGDKRGRGREEWRKGRREGRREGGRWEKVREEGMEGGKKGGRKGRKEEGREGRRKGVRKNKEEREGGTEGLGGRERGREMREKKEEGRKMEGGREEGRKRKDGRKEQLTHIYDGCSVLGSHVIPFWALLISAKEASVELRTQTLTDSFPADKLSIFKCCTIVPPSLITVLLFAWHLSCQLDSLWSPVQVLGLKSSLVDDIIAAFQDLKGCHREEGVNLFPKILEDRTRSNGWKIIKKRSNEGDILSCGCSRRLQTWQV
ncbi:Cyclic nucleotide-gated cation channel beta-1, partial [Ophiophagus hannah]